jgi:hypothetical protein
MIATPIMSSFLLSQSSQLQFAARLTHRTAERALSTLELMPENVPTIRIYPDHGHPSSLWPSAELVLEKTRNPYVLPQELGINEPDSQRILQRTKVFHNKFRDYGKTFDDRPSWAESFDVWAWYSEGYAIVKLLSTYFPSVYIKPSFSRYVFSTNEIRQNAGLSPVQLPWQNLPGHIDINSLRKRGQNSM